MKIEARKKTAFLLTKTPCSFAAIEEAAKSVAADIEDGRLPGTYCKDQTPYDSNGKPIHPIGHVLSRAGFPVESRENAMGNAYAELRQTSEKRASETYLRLSFVAAASSPKTSCSLGGGQVGDLITALRQL